MQQGYVRVIGEVLPGTPGSFSFPFPFRNDSCNRGMLTAASNIREDLSMTTSAFKSCETGTPKPPWNALAGVLHWLIAISLSGATFLTAHGETGHATLGWIALGGLLIQLPGRGKNPATGVALWLVMAGVVALNLSGLLAAQSTFHLGATLVVLAMAAFYSATILFELLQRVTASTPD